MRFAVLVALLATTGCAPTNYVLTTNTTPVCETEDIEEWQFIRNSAQGVAGKDPVGDRIDGFTAKANPLHPYATRKKTLCGTLHHFNFFDPWGDEADWNNFIIPDPDGAFFDLLRLPLLFGWADPDEVHDCEPSENNCMEAEITPDENFYSNPWFPKADDESFLEGETICTYGPWVADGGHGMRPEIHPSELYWWKFPWLGGEVFHLMLLQDDSNRYDRPEGYDDVPDPPPDSWRPWSKFPRTGEFRIAFALNIFSAEPPLTFDIFEPVDNRNVVTSEDSQARADSDNGKEHAIEYNGGVVLKVRETQDNDDDVGVRFVEVCRNAADTRLQGYVAITSKVGRGDRGDEGYHMLLVASGKEEDLDDGFPLALPTFPKVSVSGKVIRETLHREEVGGNPQLLADVEIQILSRADASAGDLMVSKVEHVEKNQRQGLVFELIQRKKGEDEPQGVVKNVPVLMGSNLELTMKSGIVLRLIAPAISLAPAITAEIPQLSNIDASAWNAMVAAAGGPQDRTAPPAQLLSVRQWQLDATPRYAPVRGGKVSPDDDSPVAEALNEVVRRVNVAHLKELFGKSQPFKVEWSFKATNLTTSAAVPVTTAEIASPTEIHVKLLPGEVPMGQIQVTFPEQPANTIYELVATIKMTDTLGTMGEVQHRVWSHVLSGEVENEIVESLLPTIATLAGVSADELVAASNLDGQAEDDRQPGNVKVVVARMLRLVMMRAAADKRITVAELRSLIRGAKLFGSR